MKLHYIIAALLAIATVSGCDNATDNSSSNTSESAQTVSYNYISAEDVAKAIRAKEKITVLDIQPKDKFDKQHIVDAVPTYAYPAKTDEEKAVLKDALAKIAPENKIIVVCPGGKSGATNTINYYREQGVDNARLYILEKGANGWPADQLSDVTVKQ